MVITRFYVHFTKLNIFGFQCAHSTNDLVCYVGLKMTDLLVETRSLCINKNGSAGVYN